MATFNPSSITAEKSIWQVWKMARRVRRNRFNEIVLGLSVLALFTYVLVSSQSPHYFAETVRSWSSTGLGFASTILGFLVAGFTIFVTMANKTMLIYMEMIPEVQSGLSNLKYNIAVFFETFFVYLGFSLLCIFVVVFGPADGVLSRLAAVLPEGSQMVFRQFAARASFFIMGGWFILLALELKSFVFNIYHLVMSLIRWAAEFPDVAVPKPAIKPSAQPSKIESRGETEKISRGA